MGSVIHNSEWMGGKREGAGRKKIGESRKLSMTLPKEDWNKIDDLISNGHASSIADYFRQLHHSVGTGWRSGL